MLMIGRRHDGPQPVIYPVGPLTMLRALLEHMIIGVGLPMVVEYFLRHTWKDWATLSRIALKRAWSALRLQQQSQGYVFAMGHDPAANARALLMKLDQP